MGPKTGAALVPAVGRVIMGAAVVGGAGTTEASKDAVTPAVGATEEEEEEEEEEEGAEEEVETVGAVVGATGSAVGACDGGLLTTKAPVTVTVPLHAVLR